MRIHVGRILEDKVNRMRNGKGKETGCLVGVVEVVAEVLQLSLNINHCVMLVAVYCRRRPRRDAFRGFRHCLFF